MSQTSKILRKIRNKPADARKPSLPDLAAALKKAMAKNGIAEPVAIPPAAMAQLTTVTLTGGTAKALSPEGQAASMPLADVLARIHPPAMDTGPLILPDGTKAVLTRGDVTLLIHQTAPAIHNCQWIANNSPAPFGGGALYRDVKIAQPYIFVFAAFQRVSRNGQLVLSGRNECFYGTSPLSSLDDKLLFPALLNVSKFKDPTRNPLAWICTQKIDTTAMMRLTDDNARLRAGFRALMQTLFCSSFNHSSEMHEGQSWWGETVAQKIDPRIATIEAFQEHSAKSPLFVLDVPWLKTNLTAGQIADRIFGLFERTPRKAQTADDVARVIFNHQ